MNYKILIIGILLGGITIVGASIAVGINVRDREVEENAYEAGLKFDETRKREAELGWKLIMPPTALAGKAAVSMDIVDRNGAVIVGASVELELARLGGHEVGVYHASSVAGHYVAQVLFEEPGWWEARVQVSRGGDSLRFEHKLQVQ